MAHIMFQGTINVLYFQSLLWISLPLYPIGSIIAPLLMYLHFKWQKVNFKCCTPMELFAAQRRSLLAPTNTDAK